MIPFLLMEYFELTLDSDTYKIGPWLINRYGYKMYD